MLHNPIDQSIKDKVNIWGKIDAWKRLNTDDADIKIYTQSEKIVKDLIADGRGSLKKMKKKLEQVLSRKNQAQKELKGTEEKINNINNNGVIKAVLFKVLPGIIYVVGDIMFSKELIAQGWGLGNSSQFEVWCLALAIGLAPFFVKDIIDRFIEPHLDSKSEIIKGILTFFYIGLGISMIAAFLQVAYLRGVIFKFMKIVNEGNIYEILFTHHEGVIIWAFVFTAFMFVVGGGFLLSVGTKDVSSWVKLRKAMKLKKTLISEIKVYDDKETTLIEEIARLEAYDYSADAMESLINYTSNELKYSYLTGYHASASDIMKADNELSDKKEKQRNASIEAFKNKFHLYTRELLNNKTYQLNNGGNNNA